MIFILTGSILLNLNTLSGSKITIVVQFEGKDLEIVYPFGSIFAEKDTRLGSKNCENDTLPSGTYPVSKLLKCLPRDNALLLHPPRNVQLSAKLYFTYLAVTVKLQL